MLKKCYNVGCCKDFVPDDNKEDSCRYHPQPPTFHDGKKGWDCCKKYSTDFSTCLNTPGCTVGFHNSEKPTKVEAEKLDPKYDKEVVVVESIKPRVVHRPSVDADMVAVDIKVLPSAAASIEQKLKQLCLTAGDVEKLETKAVQPGGACQNNGCDTVYKDNNTNKEVCVHHPGIAIFHEGMKFWSCCGRKTTDFAAFEAQQGCETGIHLWYKAPDVRLEWFQSARDRVTVHLYAKCVVPDTCQIAVNSVRMHVQFRFECGLHKYEKVFELFEPIKPDSCKVVLGGTKVEIVLQKNDPYPWKSLQIPNK